MTDKPLTPEILAGAGWKEEEFKKASEIAAAATSISRATYEEVRQSCLDMAAYKEAEFEKLINGLPTPLLELIKAFSEYSKNNK